jgi:hypothetical protein
MTEPESLLGLGLIFLSFGGPATVAMLKFWPSKVDGTKDCVTAAQCAERHQASQVLFDSKLETIKVTLNNQSEDIAELKGMTTRVLEALAQKHRD